MGVPWWIGGCGTKICPSFRSGPWERWKRPEFQSSKDQPLRAQTGQRGRISDANTGTVEHPPPQMLSVPWYGRFLLLEMGFTHVLLVQDP